MDVIYHNGTGIQYMIGELEQHLQAYQQTAFVTNVLLGNYRVTSASSKFDALSGVKTSQK
jgi:hypothetical protein